MEMRAEERLNWLQREHNKLVVEAFKMKKKIEKLEKALEFYADEKKYSPVTDQSGEELLFYNTYSGPLTAQQALQDNNIPAQGDGND